MTKIRHIKPTSLNVISKSGQEFSSVDPFSVQQLNSSFNNPGNLDLYKSPSRQFTNFFNNKNKPLYKQTPLNIQTQLGSSSEVAGLVDLNGQPASATSFSSPTDNAAAAINLAEFESNHFRGSDDFFSEGNIPQELTKTQQLQNEKTQSGIDLNSSQSMLNYGQLAAAGLGAVGSVASYFDNKKLRSKQIDALDTNIKVAKAEMAHRKEFRGTTRSAFA